MENNNTITLLNEGAIQEFLHSVFGRNFKSSIGAAAEGALNKALTDVVSGGRKFTISALRRTPEYQSAVKILIQEACSVKYGKTIGELVEFNRDLAKNLVNDIQTGIEKEIAEKAATGKALIDADVKAAQRNVNKVAKDVNLGKATVADLKAASKKLEVNIKAQIKWAEAQKTIAGMDKMKIGKIEKLFSTEAKVTTGTGEQMAKDVEEIVEVQTKTGIFKMTKEQLKEFPGKIMKVVVNNKMLSTLAVAGLSVTALYYFFGATDDSSTILVDENGNPLDDSTKVGGEWLPCIQNMIKTKQGVMTTTSGGQTSVFVKSTEYPKGVLYYSNGRVVNVETGDKGTYTCKEKMVKINEVVGKMLRERLLKEQSDSELFKDVSEMIYLLDFPVTGDNLQKALKKLKRYSTSPRGKEFLSLYQQSGIGGGNLEKSLKNIFTSEPSSVSAKRTMLELIPQIESGTAVVNPSTPTPGGGSSDTPIVWDKDKKQGGGENTGGGNVVNKKKKSSYHDCESKDFDLEYGCISTKIAEVQKCLGVTDDGKFGPVTMKALVDNKYDTSRGLSKDVYDAVKTNCNPATKREKLEPIKLNPRSLNMTSLAPQTIKMPELSNLIQSNRQPIDLYNALKEAGYIVGDADQTTLEDGTLLPATDRIKYKGPDLDEDILSRLDSILSTKGYDRIKQKLDKRYGDKYVWLQK